MLKRLMLIGCLVAVTGVMITEQAQASPFAVVKEDSFIIPANATVVTNALALTAGMVDIDRIVVFNEGPVTSAVAVVASDVGVLTPLTTHALAANAGESKRPRGYDIYAGVTNAYTYTARDLKVITYKATNATDTATHIRVFGR